MSKRFQNRKATSFRLAFILAVVFIVKLALATTLDDLANDLEKASKAAAKPPKNIPKNILSQVSSQTSTRPLSSKDPAHGKGNTKTSEAVDSDPEDDYAGPSPLPDLKDVVIPKAETDPNQTSAVNLAQKIDQFKKCLAVLKVDQRFFAAPDGEKNMADYVNQKLHLLEKTEANQSNEATAEARRLIYANWMVTRGLSECEDLADGPSKDRYIYLVGQEAKNDGESFEKVAATLVSERLKGLCPTNNTNCLRQIAFKKQMRKDDLVSYLKLLAPGSVKYMAYVGHGWSYGMLLGYKDMSVPTSWHTFAKQITNLGWEAARQGALYSDDLNYLGPIFARALDPQASFAIFACDGGDFIGPYLKYYLGPTRTVLSAKSGMEYKAIPDTGAWSLKLPTGEAYAGPAFEMYPDIKGAFGATQAKDFKYSQDFAALEKQAPSHDPGTGPDDMASAVLTRVGRREAWFDWVGEKADSKRLIVFDIRDREAVQAIFAVPPTGHGVTENDLNITFDSFDQRMQTLIDSRSGSERTYLEDLSERLHACMKDGVQKYY